MSDGHSEHDPVGEIVEAFVERFRRGERPSVEEYARQHPEIADEVREVLGIAAMLEEAKQPEQDVTEPWAEVDTAEVAKSLEELGDYRILRELGRGGMGIVYEAEQLSLGRRVALKVLPAASALATKSLKRFQGEARAAARLHHTNIVPVYEVGQAKGIHFFTMQYLPGHGLDKIIAELGRLHMGATAGPHADTKRGLEDFSVTDVAISLLSDQSAKESVDAAPASASSEKGAGEVHSPHAARSGETSHALKPNAPYWHNVARIGLQVADALDYAHAQGMVHRDVKPSNLLLDIHGTVWLTDFGLAKQEEQENLTQSGDVLGTLRYVAPEAMKGENDGRSDVYSLGLTLYELISLVPARNASSRAGLVQQVRDGDIPRLRRLCPKVPRDLETIIHKAASPEQARRYQTAGEMAADLRRFISDEPIHARRVTALERMVRWCRRNPGISITTGAALTAIAATVLVAFVLINAKKDEALQLAETQRTLAQENADLAEKEQAARKSLQSALDGEEKQRRRAEANLRLAEQNMRLAQENAGRAEKARDEQKQAANEARAVSEFLVVDMLEAAAPERSYGLKVTVREMLQRASRRVATAFPEYPETEAAVRVAVGRAYRALGLYDLAHEQLSAALKLQQKRLGDEHPSTLTTQARLAAALYGQGKYAEGRQLQERTIAGLNRNPASTEAEVLPALADLGTSLHALGKYAEAQKLLEEVLEKENRALGPENDATMVTLTNLAVTLGARGELSKAEALHRKALEAQSKKSGARHPWTLACMNNLAVNLNRQQRFAEAEQLYRQVLETKRQVLGPEHPDTLASAASLALALMEQDNAAEAEQSLSATVETATGALGAEHPTTLQIMENLADCLARQRKPAEAETALKKVVEGRRKTLGPEHEKTINAVLALAGLSEKLRRYAEAQKLYEEALVVRRRIYGPEHTGTLDVAYHVAGLQVLQGKYAEAEKRFAELLAAYTRVCGPEDTQRLTVMFELGGVLTKEGKFAEARQVFDELALVQQRVLGPTHPDTLAVTRVLTDLRNGHTESIAPRAPGNSPGDPPAVKSLPASAVPAKDAGDR
jgi:serine/threonine protein kinase/tetratricopeptide (TPR) repeat protein